MKDRNEAVAAMLVQKHQLDKSESKIGELDAALNALHQSQESNNNALDQALADLDEVLEAQDIDTESFRAVDVSQELQELTQFAEASQPQPKIDQVSTLDMLEFSDDMSWTDYQHSVEQYALRNNVDLSADPFANLMSPIQRIALEKRIKDEFTIKNAQCDKYDYLIAGTCGVVGGLVDVFFVGMPGEGGLTKSADNVIDSSVERFASALGWNKENALARGSNTKASAVSYLENGGKVAGEEATTFESALHWIAEQAGLIESNVDNKKFSGFKVNYDQTTSNGKKIGTGGAVNNLSLNNHHLKSLGHSPDIIGLFFSILNQFRNKSSFVSNGKLITIDTETFELKGDTFIAKIFCGFVNWLGHLFSDMAGSSGAKKRGAGIPIPFYNLLLLLDVGEFGQHKQTYATIATKVFEKGYDFRHGLAMAIPVLITELMTRLMWTCKQRFYHNKPWKECIPAASNPELRRMLLVAHGTMCLIDAGDAALRSGGEMVTFLLRTNIIGWVRFGSLALKEVHAWYNTGHIDADAVNEYLDTEYEALLKRSQF